MIRDAFAVWIIAGTSIWAQTIHPLTGRKVPANNGGGSAAAAAREDPDADDQSAIALGVMGIESGMAVADVGGITDYYVSHLSQRVGDSGTVYAVQIQPAMLDRVRKMVVAHVLSNVRIVRGTDQNPHLPAGKIDMVLLANAYSNFSHPQEMLRKIGESLKTEGKLIIIEYRAEDESGPASGGPRMTVPQIKTEVEAEGFKFQKVVGLLRQHMLIFLKSAAGAGPGQAP